MQTATGSNSSTTFCLMSMLSKAKKVELNTKARETILSFARFPEIPVCVCPNVKKIQKQEEKTWHIHY